MRLNSSRIKPRHPNSSPVGSDVKDRKILSGKAVIPKLILGQHGLSHNSRKNFTILSPSGIVIFNL